MSRKQREAEAEFALLLRSFLLTVGAITCMVPLVALAGPALGLPEAPLISRAATPLLVVGTCMLIAAAFASERVALGVAAVLTELYFLSVPLFILSLPVFYLLRWRRVRKRRWWE